ncbi:MAG: hypothetical protein LBF72_04210 [Holosporales bacterium]|jgi:ech hydrogenase subunit E|nr:hypothetical protein [Holosporales bacterium]
MYVPLLFSSRKPFHIKVITDGERLRYSRPVLDACDKIAIDQTIDLADLSHVLRTLKKQAGLFHFFYETAFWTTVEKLCGLAPSRREMVVRVFLCEAQRIISHLVCVCEVIKLAGVDWVFFEALRIRNAFFSVWTKSCVTFQDFIKRTNLQHSAHLMSADMESNFCNELYAVLLGANALITKTQNIISSFFFKQRTKGVGIISKDLASVFSLSGPNARASGLNYDIRKVNASENSNNIYNEIHFQTIVKSGGDVHSRCKLRIDEIIQSFDILKQCLTLETSLKGIETGEEQECFCFSSIFALLSDVANPDEAEDLGILQSVYALKCKKDSLRTQLSHVKPCYYSLESPWGELGFFLMNSEGSRCRCQLNGASTNAIQVFERICLSECLSDVEIIARSLDLQIGEV